VTERRDHARQLVGQRLSAVSYMLIDYSQPDRPRRIERSAARRRRPGVGLPMWHGPTFDWADHAVEFTTETGRVGAVVTDVTLHYAPWGDEGYWCSRITIAFGERHQDLSLRVSVRRKEAERLDLTAGQLLQGAVLRAGPQDFAALPLGDALLIAEHAGRGGRRQV
jgi:hypothetical protein